jgi:hypothetical protein
MLVANLRSTLLVALLSGGGCDSTVLVEDGAGGAGGASGVGAGNQNGVGAGNQNGVGAGNQNGSGAGNQNGSGAGNQNGSGAGGSTSQLEQACSNACSRISGCLSAPGSCVSDCMSVNPSCAPPYIDWLECAGLLVSNDTCDMPADCREPLGDWIECESWCIEGAQCGKSSDGTCGCSVPACGPTSLYDFQCFTGEPGSKCDCYADDELIGSCVDAASACTAEPANNCCLTLFFIPGG